MRALAVDLARHPQRDVLHARIGAEAGDGHDGVAVGDDGLDDTRQHRRNAEIRPALERDDVVRRLPGTDEAGLERRLVVRPARLAGVVAQAHAGDGSQRPEGQLGVAMLADDDGVDALRADAQVATELAAEAGRVQGGAGAEDALGREARQARGRRRQHVDGVAGHDEDGVGGGAGDARHRVGHDGQVGLAQLRARVAGLLAAAGREEDGGGAGAVVVSAGADAGEREVRGVAEVPGFAFGPVRVDVDEDDLAGQAAEEERVGGGGADRARTDYDNLGGLGAPC